jgi:hypothetical protein
LAPGCKAFWLPSDSASEGLGHQFSLDGEVCHVNIIIFMSYHDHHYPRIDIKFKPRSNQAALSDRGHEWLLLMMTCDSIGQWATERQDQSLTP